MDTRKTELGKNITEVREIVRPGIRSVAGPNKLDIDRKDQEPDAKRYNQISHPTKYARWGKKNRYPQEVVDLNVQDTTSAACLNFKIKAHYGLGLYPYRKIIDEKGKERKEPVDIASYPEIEDFFFRSEIENLLQGTATDFEWWNWSVTELIPDGKGEKFLYANRIKVVDTRLALQNEKGIIDKVYVSSEFGTGNEPLEIPQIPIFDRRNFDFDNVSNLKKQVYIAKQSSVDRTYYPLPMWQSNNNFLNLSLEISDWILSNINNSINIKYHIKYPQNYFELLCPSSAYETDQAWIAAMKSEKEALFSELDAYLAGTKNVGKYFHSYMMPDPRDSSKMIGFEIDVIKNETNHEAYLPAFDTSAAAIANAHNAPLDLVGLSLSKGMGAGSGSNIRESFNFYMQLHTQVPRQTSLEWLHLVKRVNKWPKDIFFDYKNIVFQSVNENKSGYAVENEATPTTDQK